MVQHQIIQTLPCHGHIRRLVCDLSHLHHNCYITWFQAF